MNLDGTVEVPKILFGSLMRSGNTFFRKTLESITGINTGSNLSNLASLNFYLMAQGFRAEAIIDDRSWVIKTHYPYIYPFCVPVKGCKGIVLVRNPLDMVVSLF
jgi:hypothetical protein